MKSPRALTYILIFLALSNFTIGMGTSQEKAAPGLLSDVSPAKDEALFGARIQRTMTLLETSNEDRRNPVKILFYGQSITAQRWGEIVINSLRKRFPHAEIISENRAIGGYEAPRLIRTAVHDLYPCYPDLLIFHVYGGTATGELERIISNVRRYTTSEIMVYNHHVAQFEEVNSDAFIKRTVKQDNDSEFMNYLAQKYNCELVDVRNEWKAYLKEHDYEPRTLLSDGVHLNDMGLQLIATLVERHFRFISVYPAGWSGTIRTYEAKRAADEGATDEIICTGTVWEAHGASAIGISPESSLKLRFKGNRVDVVPGYVEGQTGGTAKILIDGKPPSSNPRLYYITRPSKALGCWMPAINRISHISPLIEEDWTLRITEISDDAADFTFDVFGSKTGFDGTGNNKAAFTSNSGRVVIEPRDFMITWVQGYFKTKCPQGFEVTWSVKPLFVDRYESPALEDAARIVVIPVAQGLENTSHTLEIIPNGDGAVPIREIRVHRPPLK